MKVCARGGDEDEVEECEVDALSMGSRQVRKKRQHQPRNRTTRLSDDKLKAFVQL